MSGTCSSASEYAGTTISLSNPKTCRIDTFMSGKPVCTSTVIDPPWPRDVRGTNRQKRAGRMFRANLAETGRPAEAPGWGVQGRQKRLAGGSQATGSQLKYPPPPNGYVASSGQAKMPPWRPRMDREYRNRRRL